MVAYVKCIICIKAAQFVDALCAFLENKRHVGL